MAPSRTTRLYFDDPYLTRFLATVVALEDQGRRVYLEKTAFYPESGGQPPDRGTLAGIAVTDVVDEGDRIAHVLAEPLPGELGSRVEGIVEWRRRLDHMQQHSGQHLLSAVFEELYGIHTLSVHLSQSGSTLDLETASLAPDQLRRAEQRANELVWEARPIHVTYEDSAEARGLRKASERKGVLRIVSIESLDRSACGGTHVLNTAAIGLVLVGKTERIRGNVRLEFVCGDLALERARQNLDTLQEVARMLSVPTDQAPAIVRTTMERVQQLEKANRRLEAELAAYQGRERYQATAPDAATGVRWRIEEHPSLDDRVRALAQSFISAGPAVYIGVDRARLALLVAASADSGIEAGARLGHLLRLCGGRGGGSAQLAQGSAPSAQALDNVLAGLRH